MVCSDVGMESIARKGAGSKRCCGGPRLDFLQGTYDKVVTPGVEADARIRTCISGTMLTGPPRMPPCLSDFYGLP